MKISKGFGIPIFIPDNIILLTDGYKPSHWKLYPPGMTKMQSYFESRVEATFNTTVFFGLQYYILRYLEGVQVTRERIDQGELFINKYFGNSEVFNKEAWEYILKEHDGKLPLKIRAVKEGTEIPEGNCLMTIEATDDQCAWLVNYVETLLVKIWYPCVIATQSKYLKRELKNYHESTGMPEGAIDFAVHGFEYRGVECEEAAALCSGAHLLSFYGEDTTAGGVMLYNYYNAGSALGPVICTIPASEHSTTTTWGESHERDFLANAIKEYPNGLLATVIDSYDPERYILVYAAALKEEILARNGKLIFRPDSGDPLEMIMKVIGWLDQVFGHTTTETGYKLLNEKVGIIYGDGMNPTSMKAIYWTLKQAGWAAQNAFGSGGGLFQDVNRDTQRFAFKASWCEVNGQPRDVFKRPSSDPTKNSKSGMLNTFINKKQGKNIPSHLTFNTYQARELEYDWKDGLLEDVFENGEILRLQTLEELRQLTKV